MCTTGIAYRITTLEDVIVAAKLVEFDISLLISATARSISMGVLNNSITSGAGNIVGFIGEEVFRKIKGGSYSKEDGEHYDYDVVMPSGRTVDVKTKSCTSEPKGHYFATVANYNTKQNCDLYAFVRVEVDSKTSIPTGRAWYMGGILKDDFYTQSRFYRKGEIDPSSDFGWKFKADCYNLEYDKLNRRYSNGS